MSKCTSEGETECTLLKVESDSVLLDEELKYVLVTGKSKYELVGTKSKAALEDVLQVRKHMYYTEQREDTERWVRVKGMGMTQVVEEMKLKMLEMKIDRRVDIVEAE